MQDASPTPTPRTQPADCAGGRESQGPLPRRAAVKAVVWLVAIGALIAIVGIVPRVLAERSLARRTEAGATPDVVAAVPIAGSPTLDIVLPGNVYAFTDSPIYARSDGYLRKWLFDIGAHVHKGDLLAVIDTPELDQQLSQARADLMTARTNAAIAAVTSARYQDLLPSEAVSKQDTDTAASQSEAAKSAVKSAAANVARLESLQTFERIYAPFDGIVTARNVDVGQLVTAGTTGGGASQLFHMAAVATLRIYVGVPQSYGDAVKIGMPVKLTFDEFPGQSFEARVVRTSKYIDPASRTLLVEADYDNHAGLLTPGAYVQVHFTVKPRGTSLMVPSSALMFRAEGLRIAVVVTSPSGATLARLLPVTLGADDGNVVQIVDGLDAASPVIQNPPDALIDGEPVRLVQMPARPDAHQAPGKGT